MMEKPPPRPSVEIEHILLPDAFFTQVMPAIQDLAELKVTLYILYLLHHRRGQRLHINCRTDEGSITRSSYQSETAGFTTYKQLLSFSPLMDQMEEEGLQRALSLAERHGTIVRTVLDIDGKPEETYSVNTESELMAVSKESKYPTGKAMPGENIFTLYEQNIGVITPMIAEELKEAENLYPAQWIKQAFEEAASLNKHSWRYIVRILERWTSEGKESGKYRKHTKESDPDKYIKGKYGHLVQR